MLSESAAYIRAVLGRYSDASAAPEGGDGGNAPPP